MRATIFDNASATMTVKMLKNTGKHPNLYDIMTIYRFGVDMEEFTMGLSDYLRGSGFDSVRCFSEYCGVSERTLYRWWDNAERSRLVQLLVMGYIAGEEAERLRGIIVADIG